MAVRASGADFIWAAPLPSSDTTLLKGWEGDDDDDHYTIAGLLWVSRPSLLYHCHPILSLSLSLSLSLLYPYIHYISSALFEVTTSSHTHRDTSLHSSPSLPPRRRLDFVHDFATISEQKPRVALKTHLPFLNELLSLSLSLKAT